MASYDIKDFDVYKYDVILRPDVEKWTAAGNIAAKPFKPYYLDIPANFFVFPNQKCYFHLHNLDVGLQDKASVCQVAAHLYLSLGLPSHFQRSNVGSSAVQELGTELIEHTQSALIPMEFSVVNDSGGTEVGAQLVGDDFQETSVCIPPPFGQPMDFAIKKLNLAPGNAGTGNTIQYNTTLQAVNLKQAARLQFTILVEKKPYEKRAERY